MIISTIYLNSESSVQFLKQNAFLAFSNTLEQFEKNLEKIFGMKKPRVKDRESNFLPNGCTIGLLTYCQMVLTTEYGRPMKPLFIEIQNFWAYLGRQIGLIDSG